MAQRKKRPRIGRPPGKSHPEKYLVKLPKGTLATWHRAARQEGLTVAGTKKKPLSPARLRWIEKNVDRMIGEVEKSGLVDWSRLAEDYPAIERLTLPKTFLQRLDAIIEGLTRTRAWMAAQAQKAS